MTSMTAFYFRLTVAVKLWASKTLNAKVHAREHEQSMGLVTIIAICSQAIKQCIEIFFHLYHCLVS